MHVDSVNLKAMLHGVPFLLLMLAAFGNNSFFAHFIARKNVSNEKQKLRENL